MDGCARTATLSGRTKPARTGRSASGAAEAEAEELPQAPASADASMARSPSHRTQRAQHSIQLTQSTRDVRASKTREQRDDGATQDTEWARESARMISCQLSATAGAYCKSAGRHTRLRYTEMPRGARTRRARRGTLAQASGSRRRRDLHCQSSHAGDRRLGAGSPEHRANVVRRGAAARSKTHCLARSCAG